MGFIIVSLNQQNDITSRTVATRDAETALAQLSRDLRQAMPATIGGTPVQVQTTAGTPPTTTISFSIPTRGASTNPQGVTWTCQGSVSSPGYCKRAIGATNLTEVVGYEALSFSNGSQAQLTPPITNPGYLGISLTIGVTSQLDAKQYTSGAPTVVANTNPITIQTGVDLRNLQ
jgi:hypothetical protein